MSWTGRTGKDLGDYAQQISLFEIQKTDYGLIKSSSIDIVLNCFQFTPG